MEMPPGAGTPGSGTRRRLAVRGHGHLQLVKHFARHDLPEMAQFLIELGEHALGKPALGVLEMQGQECLELIGVVIDLDSLIDYHVVIDKIGEMLLGIVDIRHAAAHAGAEIVADRTENGGETAGHVFAAIVAAAFDHGDRT